MKIKKRYLGIFFGLLVISSVAVVVMKLLSLSVHEVTYIGSNMDRYKGQVTVEIPEMYELVYVVCALTETFQDRTYLLNRDTEYHKEILSNFGPYQNHPLVRKVDKKVRSKRLGRLNQKLLRFDGIRYMFDEKGQIKRSHEYRLGWISLLPVLGINKIREELEDFSRLTQFREFYFAHQKYYSSLIEIEKKLCDFDRIWRWLERQFPERYDSYRVIISPLTGGYHFIQIVKTAKKKKDFKQTIIYVNPPFKGEDLDSVKISALNTRSVFTEIDHSYVNPIAEDFKKDIRTAMEDFKKWNNGNSGYPNPMLTFCEYMTWSVFNLYAWETYDRDAFEYVNQNTETNMVENRRFIKFREFNRQLLHLYQNKIKTQTIGDFFPQIIKWMGNQ